MINTTPYRPQTSTRQDSAQSPVLSSAIGQRRPPPFLAFLAALAPFLARFPVAAPPPSPERLACFGPVPQLLIRPAGRRASGPRATVLWIFVAHLGADGGARAAEERRQVLRGRERGASWREEPSTTATRRRSGPIRGVSAAPNHSCSFDAARRTSSGLLIGAIGVVGDVAQRGAVAGGRRQLGGCRCGQGRLELIRQRLVGSLARSAFARLFRLFAPGRGRRESFLRALDEARSVQRGHARPAPPP